MNWGYKILTVVIVFVLGMSAMVYIAMRQTNEMIDDDYYVKELQFQHQIDAEKRLQSLPEQLVVKDTSDGLHITLPASAASEISGGQLRFIRPSDQKKDFTLAFSDESAKGILVPRASLLNGVYKMSISWKSKGVAYYSEQNLTIN